jgi:ribosome-associated protein
MSQDFDPSTTTGDELAPGVRASTIRWQFARSGGPGGQNVNKLNTKAEIWVPVDSLLGLRPRALERLLKLAGNRLTVAGEIHISAETERTQEGNRQAALGRLRELLLEAMLEPKIRRKTKPTRASKRRRLEFKRRRSQIKAHRRGRRNNNAE